MSVLQPIPLHFRVQIFILLVLWSFVGCVTAPVSTAELHADNLMLDTTSANNKPHRLQKKSSSKIPRQGAVQNSGMVVIGDIRSKNNKAGIKGRKLKMYVRPKNIDENLTPVILKTDTSVPAPAGKKDSKLKMYVRPKSVNGKPVPGKSKPEVITFSHAKGRKLQNDIPIENPDEAPSLDRAFTDNESNDHYEAENFNVGESEAINNKDQMASLPVINFESDDKTGDSSSAFNGADNFGYGASESNLDSDQMVSLPVIAIERKGRAGSTPSVSNPNKNDNKKPVEVETGASENIRMNISGTDSSGSFSYEDNPVSASSVTFGNFNKSKIKIEHNSLSGWRSVIKQAQASLLKNGFDPGPVDGIWGPQTAVALKKFQKKEGLSINGILDNPTKRRLLISEKNQSDKKTVLDKRTWNRVSGDSFAEFPGAMKPQVSIPQNSVPEVNFTGRHNRGGRKNLSKVNQGRRSEIMNVASNSTMVAVQIIELQKLLPMNSKSK